MNSTLTRLIGLSLILLCFSCKQESSSPPQVAVAPGFTVDHLYSPTDNEHGSWVAMTRAEDNSIYTSDQYGALYKVFLPEQGETQGLKVQKLDVEIGGAQGLLWAHNSLYVMVNSNKKNALGGNTSGLYRITDSDSDGELDLITQLKAFEGNGEHGPHSIIPSPEGDSLYLICGNMTQKPEFDDYLLPKTWGDDNLFEAVKEPRGHATNVMPPGGWVARIDPEGKHWTLVSTGYRNSYDMAFNEAGELFVFDSDMEWDLGMPWYRPIRLCHATSGSEYGWRNSSGKWPEYYPDNLPSVLDIGQGSPTGVFMGKGAKFPERYQKGMFLLDWSFGTMYFVELEQDGATYRGKKEEFLSGVPLPLTDAIIGNDGALYFMTGGRRLRSDFYRVTYTGEESTSPATLSLELTAEQKIRKELEKFHKPHPEAVAMASQYVSHSDRFVQYAARIALEHQQIDSWLDEMESESDPRALIAYIIAASRSDKQSEYTRQIIDALSKLEVATLESEDLMAAIRAHALVGIRQGKPDGNMRIEWLNKFEALYPHEDPMLNRELCRLLVFLGSDQVVSKTLAMLDEENSSASTVAYISEEMTARSEQYGPIIAKMLAKLPPSQEINLIESLSHAENGWTMSLREKYFSWFYDALSVSGGESYKGYLDQIRQRALRYVPEDAQEKLADLSGAVHLKAESNLADLPQPKGPGKDWQKQDIWETLRSLDDRKPNFENGKNMYAAALCESCHRMQGAGGSIGPDLTKLNTRFSLNDMVQAILTPSMTISDQYAADLITLKDNSTVAGRIVEENDESLWVSTNPYYPDERTEIELSNIESREKSPLSTMPPGLINRLNGEELQDLLAYLQAGGDAEHKEYQ